MEKTEYSVYSTHYYDCAGGRRRIYDDVLKGFNHVYDFDYLIRFFEEKAREYFSISIAEDEKFYKHRKDFPYDDDYSPDFVFNDNYFSVLKIVWAVKTLNVFYDRGYDFKIIDICAERDGWMIKFVLDTTNLTYEQNEIIFTNVFEQNPFETN